MKTDMRRFNETRHERMMAESACAAIRFLLSPEITQFFERNQESLQKILAALPATALDVQATAFIASLFPSEIPPPDRRYYPDILESD